MTQLILSILHFRVYCSDICLFLVGFLGGLLWTLFSLVQLLKMLQLQQCTSGTFGWLVELPPGTTPGRGGDRWRAQNSCLQIEMPIFPGHSVDHPCKNALHLALNFPICSLKADIVHSKLLLLRQKRNSTGCGLSHSHSTCCIVKGPTHICWIS